MVEALLGYVLLYLLYDAFVRPFIRAILDPLPVEEEEDTEELEELDEPPPRRGARKAPKRRFNVTDPDKDKNKPDLYVLDGGDLDDDELVYPE
jgi:hypothetical protein